MKNKILEVYLQFIFSDSDCVMYMNPTDTASQTIDIQTANVYKIFTGRRSEIMIFWSKKQKQKQ